MFCTCYMLLWVLLFQVNGKHSLLFTYTYIFAPLPIYVFYTHTHTLSSCLFLPASSRKSFFQLQEFPSVFLVVQLLWWVLHGLWDVVFHGQLFQNPCPKTVNSGKGGHRGPTKILDKYFELDRNLIASQITLVQATNLFLWSDVTACLNGFWICSSVEGFIHFTQYKYWVISLPLLIDLNKGVHSLWWIPNKYLLNGWPWKEVFKNRYYILDPR